MRRTVGWVLGLAVTVALAGAAAASAPGDERPAPTAGRELVGTVERVAELVNPGRARTLRYPGSSYVKVHLTGTALMPGDHVTVTDPSGQEIQRYRGEAIGRGRWTMSVAGDTAVVTVHSKRRFGGVTVDRVARGLRPEERPARPESICGRDEKSDAVCYRSSDPTAYHRSKAVARLLINGVELCTAWRIGPQNRLLTNNHCFTQTADARNTEVWFNYMCAECGGFEVFRPTKVWGDRVLATDEVLDYTLFTVDNFGAVEKYGYLELDLRRPDPGEELYIPQHPGGDPTEIASGGNCVVDDPNYDGYDVGTDISYFCDTEGGSSGSPVLLAGSDKVVALHHFGGCPNSGVRMDLVHQEIANLI